MQREKDIINENDLSVDDQNRTMSGNVPSLYYRDSTKNSRKMDNSVDISIDDDIKSELKYDQNEYDQTRQMLLQSRQMTTVRLLSNPNSMSGFEDPADLNDKKRDSYMSTA